MKLEFRTEHSQITAQSEARNSSQNINCGDQNKRKFR
uniref:Uncharacterized protein n=1 Tax=Arundo donax TaxID=35708 RepID=A0A0A8YS79_ARUDO